MTLIEKSLKWAMSVLFQIVGSVITFVLSHTRNVASGISVSLFFVLSYTRNVTSGITVSLSFILSHTRNVWHHCVFILYPKSHQECCIWHHCLFLAHTPKTFWVHAPLSSTSDRSLAVSSLKSILVTCSSPSEHPM